MENNIIVKEPEHPVDVLLFFDTSKEKIKLFADLVIDEVKEGKIDALKVKALCKSMESISETIDKNTRDEQKREAEKFGDKPFLNYGCEMHLTATKTEYDYDSCNDDVYNRLMTLKHALDQQIKLRMGFLKNLSKPEILVDEATGNQYTANPPVKNVSMGVKVSIK